MGLQVQSQFNRKSKRENTLKMKQWGLFLVLIGVSSALLIPGLPKLDLPEPPKSSSSLSWQGGRTIGPVTANGNVSINTDFQSQIRNWLQSLQGQIQNNLESLSNNFQNLRKQFGELPGLNNIKNILQPSGLQGLNSNGASSIPGLPNSNGASSIPGLPNSNGASIIPGLPNSSGNAKLPDFSEILKNLGKLIPGLDLSKLPSLSDIDKGLKQQLPDLGNFLQQGKNIFKPEDAQTKIENALKGLEQRVNATAARNEIIANSSLNNFKQFSQKLNTSIQDLIQKSSEGLKDAISKLNNSVNECVTKEGNPAETLRETLKEKATECVRNKVEEAQTIVTDSRDKVQAAIQNLQEIRSALSKCRANISVSTVDVPITQFTDTSCITSALLNIQSESILLPVKIAQQGSQAYNLIQSLQGYAIKCAAQVATETAKAGAEVSRKVAQCVASNSSSDGTQ